MEIVIRRTDRADEFAALFQHIKMITDNIVITFDNSHMKMQCMDNAHIAIMEICLPAEWFDVYDLSDSGSVRIGCNSTYLHRILSSLQEICIS